MKSNDAIHQIFEINDSNIDIKKIMDEIDSRLKKRDISREDLEKMVSFRENSHLEINYREFDPSYIAHQFEAGISPPKFMNPKFRFVRGPIRKMVTFLVDMYSAIEKRLSTNRIRAFYSAVYELTILRARIESLEKQIQKIKINSVSEPVEKYTFKPNDLNLDSDEELIGNIMSSDKVLILFPTSDRLILELRNKNIIVDIITLSDIISELNNSEKKRGNSKKLKKANYNLYSKIIIHQNICTIHHSVLEKVLWDIAKNGESGSKLLIRFSNYSVGTQTPFKEIYKTFIQVESLYSYFRTMGYYNVVIQSIPEDYSILSSYIGNENITTHSAL